MKIIITSFISTQKIVPIMVASDNSRMKYICNRDVKYLYGIFLMCFNVFPDFIAWKP